MVVSADAVAKIHSLNGLNDSELTWERKQIIPPFQNVYAKETIMANNCKCIKLVEK